MMMMMMMIIIIIIIIINILRDFNKYSSLFEPKKQQQQPRNFA